MKNNLLFVNQNREIIREFLDAMKEYSFEINTASSSAEVAAFLKKKKYKLVITGMNLSGLNGSKLIAYLNQYCPQTVCIVYTRRLELAHLKLLVNDRKVFRIFQKPADFRTKTKKCPGKCQGSGIGSFAKRRRKTGVHFIFADYIKNLYPKHKTSVKQEGTTLVVPIRKKIDPHDV